MPHHQDCQPSCMLQSQLAKMTDVAGELCIKRNFKMATAKLVTNTPPFSSFRVDEETKIKVSCLNTLNPYFFTLFTSNQRIEGENWDLFDVYDFSFIPKRGILNDCVEASYARRRVLSQVCYGTFFHKTKWLPFPNVSNITPCLFLLKV